MFSLSLSLSLSLFLYSFLICIDLISIPSWYSCCWCQFNGCVRQLSGYFQSTFRALLEQFPTTLHALFFFFLLNCWHPRLFRHTQLFFQSLYPASIVLFPFFFLRFFHSFIHSFIAPLSLSLSLVCVSFSFWWFSGDSESFGSTEGSLRGDSIRRDSGESGWWF